MVGDPGDGAGEAFFQVDGGGPVEVFFRFAVVAEEAHDFGFFRAQAVGILADLEVGFVEDLEDEVGDFADGDFSAGAEVEFVAE